MSIRVLHQKDHLKMEATIDPKSDVAEVHDWLRSMKTNARLVVLYNGGAVQAINVEQNSKMTDAKSVEVRGILAIKSVKLPT